MNAWVRIAILSVAAAGCGGDARKPLNGATRPECTKSVGSAVVGGKVTLDYPETSLIGIKKNDGSISYCTGSFYSPRIVIFAAHCTVNSKSYLVYKTREETTEVYVHPNYAPEVSSVANASEAAPILRRAVLTGRIDDAIMGAVDTEDDAAMLVFPKRADRVVVGISASVVATTPVRIVGYGSHEGSVDAPVVLGTVDDLGKLEKRVGVTTVAYFIGQNIVTIGGLNGTARVGNGDSGGTLFHAVTGLGIGFVSAGGPDRILDVQAWAAYRGTGRSYFVNLTSPTVKSFVQATFLKVGEPDPYAVPPPPSSSPVNTDSSGNPDIPGTSAASGNSDTPPASPPPNGAASPSPCP